MRPESSGGARVTSALDSTTKVLEIMSLGIKVRTLLPHPALTGTGDDIWNPALYCAHALQVRNTKVFTVLNPTSAAFHFVWEPEGGGAAASGAAAAAADPGLSCLTRHGTIAAGQRAEMAFEFSPASPEPLVRVNS